MTQRLCLAYESVPGILVRLTNYTFNMVSLAYTHYFVFLLAVLKPNLKKLLVFLLRSLPFHHSKFERISFDDSSFPSLVLHFRP
jgi:hypothetical protein